MTRALLDKELQDLDAQIMRCTVSRVREETSPSTVKILDMGIHIQLLDQMRELFCELY